MTAPSRQDRDEHLLASLIDDMPFVGMALLAPDGARWLRVNDRLCEILAYRRDELLAIPWSRLAHAEELASWQVKFEQLRNGQLKDYSLELRLIGKRGESVETLVNLRRMSGPDGGSSYLIKTVSEIGGRRQAEKALRTANERLTRAQHAAGAGLWEWDMLADRLEWSGELFQLFGLDPARDIASQETWSSIVHCDDLGLARERIQYAIRNHTPLASEYRVILPSLETRWISALGDTTYDAAGRPARMSGICLDISARKQADAVLRAERDRSQRYLDTVETVIVALDATGRITLLNRKGLALLGYAAGELDGENWFERCLPASEGRAQVYPIFRQLMAGEMANVEYFENSVLTRNGEQRLIAWRNTLLQDELGRISGVLSAGEDITERRLAENALRYQLDLNQSITDKATDSIFVNDAEGRVTFVNPEAVRFFGYSEEELLGRHLHDVIHHTREDGQPYPMHACPLCQVYANGRAIRDHGTVFFRKDGSQVHVTASNAALEANGKPAGEVLVLHDVTASRHNEQALRESEARLQLATEIGRSGTWDWDLASGEVIWSRGHFDILGYALDAVKPCYQAWLDRVHPEDRAEVEANIRLSMAARQDYVAEFRVVWPDASVHWMSARGRYAYAENGTCVRMIGVMADVTSMKKAELELLDANRRKDEFLAMLAHELRNPLAPIRNAAHVLRRLKLDEPRVRWAQEIIERQVAHLSHLVDDLLDVSRIVRGKVNLRIEPIDLPVLVRHAIESTRPLMDAMRHQLHVQLPSAPVPLAGDPTRLLQVLVNLLDNAAKYTKAGGHIELVAEVRTGWLEIALRDNGLGMSPELLPRVFDLFSQGERTLDRAQGGLGIGLTLVRNLVEMHGGQVTAASPGPGQGSTFTLRLPLDMTPDGELPDRPDTGMGLRILIVDDDPAVAESMAMFLEMEGHTTLTAATGEAALESLADFRPGMILLDLGLPGLDGYSVARRIRQQPGGEKYRLIAVSGYGNEEVISRCFAVGFDRHMLKPLDPAALSQFLAESASKR